MTAREQQGFRTRATAIARWRASLRHKRRAVVYAARSIPRLWTLALFALAGTWPSNLAAQTTARSKDVWDKLNAASGIVAGALVATIGGFATYGYNRRAERELAVRRVQTIQTFLPLLKADEDREAALLAIDALGDHELANKFALLYGGRGSVAALSRIAATTTDELADHAVAALSRIAATATDEAADLATS